MRVASLILSAASIPVLARLVPPADFGVWAMAGFSLGLMSIVREFGLVSSIVQARTLTRAQQDGYFWASVTVSLAAVGVLALVAPVLASFYDAPLVAPVVWVCCLSLAIGGIGLVHTALLRRELRYHELVVIEGGGLLAGTLVTVACAFLWRDVWALAAGHIAGAVWMSAAALALYRWVPARPRRACVKDLGLSFSLQLTWFNVLGYAGNNIGLVAGYRLRADELGFFGRAQQLQQLAHYTFLAPITEVGFTLLCRLKAEAAYRKAYVALARRVAVLFIPYAAVLPLLSGDLVLVLLGPAWAPAAPILAWFAPAVLGQAFASLFAQLLTSQGRGAELRRWAAVDFALRAGGALIGSQFGLVGLAAGFSLATFLSIPLMLWTAGRSGPVQLRHQAVAIWPGALLGAAATMAAALAVLVADHVGLAVGWSRLSLTAGSAGLAWALSCLALRPARAAVLA